MAGNLSADASLAVEHHLGEHHAVERFAMLEGEQDGGHAILSEGAGGDMYLRLLGLFFVLFHGAVSGIEEVDLVVKLAGAHVNMDPPLCAALDAYGVGQLALYANDEVAHLVARQSGNVEVNGLALQVSSDIHLLQGGLLLHKRAHVAAQASLRVAATLGPVVHDDGLVEVETDSVQGIEQALIEEAPRFVAKALIHVGAYQFLDIKELGC